MDYSTLEIAGAQAVELLELKRVCYSSSGMYPFLIGDSDDLTRLQLVGDFENRSPGEIIHSSAAVDLSLWMARRQEEEELYDFDPAKVLGTWPASRVVRDSITVHRDDLTNKAKPRVQMGLATIDQPWHLPAVLRFGNWNDCPDAVVHCAFLQHWQREFGAEIACASSHTLECIVSRPPLDQDAALHLAWEQFWYCENIVHEEYQTISNLAAALLGANYWYFWWD
ncbi:DUF4253 domain-containing protein [Aeoliella sp. ICT_H6.2]|uniref:DUF4253 domain-containing protein n=1 Tax=Aeoliella straminimaris TaxID=2954799 RepID=A0A9X2F7Y6_9BACT|nr:DUF4253 domain-containing protein [Aeoliella straminimaris]MCO6044027.1 DUF4253 domain-containing protein [Aeoliella straminimaris]